MKAPGFSKHPEHHVDAQRMSQKIEIYLDNDCIVESEGAIKVIESNCEDRIYVPINDLTRIDLIKIGDYHCPYKGDAELYDVKHGEHTFKNAAWSYVKPYDDFPELLGRVAFYPEKMQEIRVL